ncbi:hypothetical protein SAMN06265375_101440 [Muriicola jejuensis]|uniref:Uncharacterized protein n=1 Tax=Muriicola jejuensis TaxID=504488 RepID=A0A6P0UDN2_9FLAO|nr:hypothetical protein [Muriicola jejuensis]NER10029.1 hypothetical protein [Muriicola jejuensis]SMP03620.1 hypothetical protein SAMN06265375_101440 [Muriicola jejuensis]
MLDIKENLGTIQEAFIYTMVTVFLSLLPFIILYALIYFSGLDLPRLLEIIGRGELIIVCVSIGAGIIYTLVNTNRQSKVPLFHLAFWVTLGFIVIGVAIYAAELRSYYLEGLMELNDNTGLEASNKSMGFNRITKFSKYFLVWIFITLLYSRFFDKRNPTSLVRSRNRDEDDLFKKVTPSN